MMPPPSSRIESWLRWSCAAWLMLTGLAHAADRLDDRLTLNAFGTLGLTRSTSEQPGYRSNSNYQFDIGQHWSGLLDNRLGVQLSAQADPQLALTVQTLVRRNGDARVKPEIPWAYLRWQPEARWELRIGRLRQPLFMITEEIDVGYAHPWARPPAEVYSLSGESNAIDGVLLRYRQPLGSYTLGVDGYAGRYTLKRIRYVNRIKRNLGVALSLTDGALTLRTTLATTDTHLRMPSLESAAALIAAQNAAVGREYAAGDMQGYGYISLGLRYEAHDWLAMAEYVQTDAPSRLTPDQQAAYVTLGRSLGDWLPYVSLARLRTLSTLQETRLAGHAALVANTLLAGQNRDQSTLSLGLRWDAHPNLALKAQLDRVRPDKGAYGLQATPLPPGRSAFTVGSIVMDWVY